MSQVQTQSDPHRRNSPPEQQMRAGVYRGPGRISAETVPIPRISEGEALMRVEACGVCGTDVKKIQHGFVPPPQIFGHEIAGTIVQVGEGVTRWKPEQRVITFHHVPCGSCFYCECKLFSQCPQYRNVGVTAGFDPNGGGFAQYVRVMPWIVERGMIAIPPDITFEEAIFVEPVNTCLKAVRKARVSAGEIVFVTGQGPVGVLLMMLSCLAGASVFTSDPIPARRAKSIRFGAAASFDPSETNPIEEIRARTGGRGADAVLLAAPHPALVVEGLAEARPGGRVLLFAHNDPSLQIQFPAASVGVEEKELLGSYSASVDLQDEAARLVFERRLPLHEMISHRFSLEEIDQALALASRPKEDSLKLLIIP